MFSDSGGCRAGSDELLTRRRTGKRGGRGDGQLESMVKKAIAPRQRGSGEGGG